MRKRGNKINTKKLEKIIKGFSNHRRLQILYLLEREPELSVEQISNKLRIGYMNASDHIRKLAIAGLVSKRNRGVNVLHTITSRAKIILAFCKKLK